MLSMFNVSVQCCVNDIASTMTFSPARCGYSGGDVACHGGVCEWQIACQCAQPQAWLLQATLRLCGEPSHVPVCHPPSMCAGSDRVHWQSGRNSAAACALRTGHPRILHCSRIRERQSVAPPRIVKECPWRVNFTYSGSVHLARDVEKTEFQDVGRRFCADCQLPAVSLNQSSPSTVFPAAVLRADR